MRPAEGAVEVGGALPGLKSRIVRSEDPVRMYCEEPEE